MTSLEYEVARARNVVDETLIVTYDESRGMPLVVKSVSTTRRKQGAGPPVIDTQFDLTYRDEKPSPADFLVSAFGLPEPPEQKTGQKTPK